MTKPRLTGKLNKPIEVILTYPKWSDSDSMMKVNVGELRRAHTEMVDRLELLFPHYGIDRTGNAASDFQRLAVCLAGEVFPGFRIKEIDPRRYKHRRSNPLTLLLLLADMETVKQEKLRRRNRINRIITDIEAVAVLTTDPRFRKEWGDKGGKTLLNWLADARDSAKNPFLSDWNECKSEHKLPWIIAMINWIARDQSRALRKAVLEKPKRDQPIRKARAASLKLEA
jgi:hypothetical protein